jgi:TM2 domain-containing membrane protein YozV
MDEFQQLEVARVLAKKDQRHGFPALLSLFVPGLGQLIKGDFLLGFLIWVAMGVAAISCFIYIGMVLVPLFWLIQIYDAYTTPDAQTKRELRAIGRR